MIKEAPEKRAGEGNRTLVCSLGSCRSTIELHPQRWGDLLTTESDSSKAKSTTGDIHRDLTGLWCTTVLEKKNSLPSPENHFSV